MEVAGDFADLSVVENVGKLSVQLPCRKKWPPIDSRDQRIKCVVIELDQAKLLGSCWRMRRPIYWCFVGARIGDGQLLFVGLLLEMVVPHGAVLRPDLLSIASSFLVRSQRAGDANSAGCIRHIDQRT